MSAEPTAIRDVYVLVWRGRSLLMLERSGTGYRDGEWVPPSGKVEPDESYLAGAARELAEETGVRAATLVPVHFLERATHDGGRWIGAFFAVDGTGVEPRNLEPEKHSSMRWFDREALPATTFDYVRHVLVEIANGRTYSEWIDPETGTG